MKCQSLFSGINKEKKTTKNKSSISLLSAKLSQRVVNVTCFRKIQGFPFHVNLPADDLHDMSCLIL